MSPFKQQTPLPPARTPPQASRWSWRFILSGRRTHYTVVGIAFHWTMAAMVFAQLGLGWWMGRLGAGWPKLHAYEIHAGLGAAILLLVPMRIAWRFLVPRPISTEDIPGWQHIAARATHYGLYGLMIALPLTGIVIVAGLVEADALRAFGLVPLPVVSWVVDLPVITQAKWEGRAELAHDILVWTMIGLIVAHVGAALKHHLIDRDAVLHRMAPAIEPLGEEEIHGLTDAR